MGARRRRGTRTVLTPKPSCDAGGAGRPASGCRLAGRVVLLAVVGALAGGCDAPEPARATLTVAGILAEGDTAGFARADRPRDFTFPADHGPHPGFRHEWWYVTGNVQDADGGWFGFQLTFFRSALRPGTGAVASPWAADQAYMAHFAVTDADGGRFHAFERFDRGALGLAGATTDPVRVHVGDWELALERAPPGDSLPTFRIRAAEAGVEVDLRLQPVKPPVLQGEEGLSRKGPEPGNASYYYSLPRLAATGTLRAGAATRVVTGWAWLDREWGTSALGPELEGWDWFAVQLDDGSELMFYRLRRHDGGADPLSRGSLVEADGRARPLGAGDVRIEAVGEWRSPRSGAYPAGWRVRVPAGDLELRIEPVLADQELDLTFRYWEGAVTVEGRRGAAPVRGRGYVELTGYAERDAMGRGDSSGAGAASTGRPSTLNSR